MPEPTITESRDINAPAARIFSILVDPAMHPSIDGTGMLRSAVDSELLSKVGDVFYMTMVHWDVGNYVVQNHVVEFEQDRRIAWDPLVDSIEKAEYEPDASGSPQQRWGWQLEPLSDGNTRVTEFFDCTRCTEDLRNYIKDGEFWRLAMKTSLMNLERLATES
jgi:hypothetical protein